MSNALDPNRMSPAERLAEIGRILAAGLIRMKARQSSGLSAENGDCFVDLPSTKSGSRGGKTFRTGGQHED
jgi:hypothetical protein